MDFSSIQPFLDWLALHQQWVALAIVLIAFLESLAIAGVVIPGVLLLFGAATVAGTGALGLWPTLACGFVGAVLGDGLSFLLGKSLKQHIKEIWPFRRYPEWIANGEKYFLRHGGQSVIAGRFVGPIRPVIPLIAGMLDMPALRFFAINVLSALAWAPVYILPGYLFGASVRWGVQFPEGFGTLLSYSLAIMLIVLLALRLVSPFLDPASRLYSALHRYIQQRENMRLFWQLFTDRRQGRQHFPLASLLLLLSCALGLLLLALLARHPALHNINAQTTAFFLAIQHPWLDPIFAALRYFMGKTALSCYGAAALLWLIWRHHFAAAVHVLLAALLLGLALNLLSSWVDDNIALTALGAGLAAAFIGQEVAAHQRGWIAGASMAPTLLIVLAELYAAEVLLRFAISSALLGFLFCAGARLSFNRFNTREIRADKTLALLMSLAALVAVLLQPF